MRCELNGAPGCGKRGLSVAAPAPHRVLETPYGMTTVPRRAELMPPLIYLVAPYRHSEDSVQDARLEAVSRVAAALTDADRRVFCPLTHAHALIESGLGFREDEWRYEYDIGLLTVPNSWCSDYPAGRKARGVGLEIEAAQSRDILISYLDTPERFAGLTSDRSDDLRRRLSWSSYGSGSNGVHTYIDSCQSCRTIQDLRASGLQDEGRYHFLLSLS